MSTCSFRKLIGVACSATLVFAISSHAQAPGRPLSLQAGIVAFPNPEYDSLALVESYFSVLKQDFDFFQADSTHKRTARVFVQLDILDSTGRAVDSGNTYFAFEPESTKTSEPVAVFNKIAFLVKPGLYSMRLTAIDAVSKREGEVFFPRVTVPRPIKDTLSIGGLLIASDLSYVGETDDEIPGRLTKNGFKILPNPLSIFTSVDSSAAVYGEIYNLHYDPAKASTHTISYRILNDAGTEYLSLGQKSHPTVGTSEVISEKLDIKQWPVDNYFLEVSVLDKANGSVDTVVAPLHIIQPRIDLPDSTTQAAVAANAYDSLSLADQVKMVMYLLSPTEKEALGRLIPAGQKSYLDQYWKEAEANALSSGHSTTKLELVRRFRYANDIFSTDEAKVNGYLTERGRVYMTYGAPDELDDYPTPRTGNPYQVWNYRTMKEGKFFVFEDKTGYNDYRLVHSNVPGEPYSKAWQEIMIDLLKRQDQD